MLPRLGMTMNLKAMMLYLKSAVISQRPAILTEIRSRSKKLKIY